jgi:hypothetical protein
VTAVDAGHTGLTDVPLFALDTGSLGVLGHEPEQPVVRAWNGRYDPVEAP